jgi:CheY-like chemotaxis protein
MNGLSGKCILVVEDESVVARMLDDMLSDRGVHVVGPAATLASALALADSETIDVALLDVNLNGERSLPVAQALRRRGIPYVLATGYVASECDDYPSAQVLQKPYHPAQLLTALCSAVSAD